MGWADNTMLRTLMEQMNSIPGPGKAAQDPNYTQAAQVAVGSPSVQRNLQEPAQSGDEMPGLSVGSGSVPGLNVQIPRKKSKMEKAIENPIADMDHAADVSQEEGDERQLAAQDVANRIDPAKGQAIAAQGGHFSLDPERPADQHGLLGLDVTQQITPANMDSNTKSKVDSAVWQNYWNLNHANQNEAREKQMNNPYYPGRTDAKDLVSDVSPPEAFDHPVAKAIVGSKTKHEALKSFMDIMHKDKK